ncbi:hypothetical protein LEP1GSC170_3079 [Leptospira interrogans serovar Bataviae str. HAI135]|nr:hypothetical protein LEP1GSC170_3079 [Leptospira interrogans serovar Bataviae str. HAI135]
MSHFNYEICERFAPIFLRRTHVKIPNDTKFAGTTSFY